MPVNTLSDSPVLVLALEIPKSELRFVFLVVVVMFVVGCLFFGSVQALLTRQKSTLKGPSWSFLRSVHIASMRSCTFTSLPTGKLVGLYFPLQYFIFWNVLAVKKLLAMIASAFVLLIIFTVFMLFVRFAVCSVCFRILTRVARQSHPRASPLLKLE